VIIRGERKDTLDKLSSVNLSDYLAALPLGIMYATRSRRTVCDN